MSPDGHPSLRSARSVFLRRAAARLCGGSPDGAGRDSPARGLLSAASLRASRARQRHVRLLTKACNATGERTPSRLRVLSESRLEDRYVFTDRAVGEGLNGVVRMVADKVTSRQCALKTIGISEDDEEEGNLLKEMEVYLRMDHPNICRLLEVYIGESCCHLIMELCTGGDLCARWEARGTYSEEDTRAAVAQMLDATSYMHNQQICHRDLKLENWVYADPSENARLKLIDFGFSELFCLDAPMTAVLGTIFYVAPEVLTGSYDCKCDVWSLGVMTYMLLSGVAPFGDFEDSDMTIFAKIVHGGNAVMAGTHWDGVSGQARDLISKLLDRSPARRPTAQEALGHPWLQGRSGGLHALARDIDVEVLERLRSFASMNLIKRAACGLIASSMSVAETDELEAQFKRLDKDGSGMIAAHELVEALQEHLDMEEDEAAKLFQRCDLAGNRNLRYSEFLAAVTQRRFMAQERSICRAFQRFDVDNTGCISLENLRAVLGDEYMGTRVEDIILQVGHGDVIHYADFVHAMMDLGSGEAALCGADSVERVKNVSRALEFTSLGRPRAASGGASCSGAALQRRRCAGERARVSGTRSELQTRLAAPGLAARRGAAGGNQPEDASPESAGSSCTSTPCAKFTRVLSEPLDPRLQSQRSDVLPPADEAHRCFTVAALPTWRPR